MKSQAGGFYLPGQSWYLDSRDDFEAACGIEEVVYISHISCPYTIASKKGVATVCPGVPSVAQHKDDGLKSGSCLFAHVVDVITLTR